MVFLMIKVTVWNEFWHETCDEAAMKMYPGGIHERIAEILKSDDVIVRTAWLEKDEWQGLPEELLDDTDVLIWWGHCRHQDVRDDTVDRVVKHVLDGMGFIPIHSAHICKPFRRLMGTTCSLQWRDSNERARVWCVNPGHPIAKGIPLSFELDAEEMYGEFFDVPQPDEQIFVTWFQGGEVFRGGATWRRGEGKIFYFHPGHETCPSYYNPNVMQILRNAVRWAAKLPKKTDLNSGNYAEPKEKINSPSNEEVFEKYGPRK